MLHDLRYALRTLRKSPGFTAVAVLTLALGIGANAAIFSVVNGVLLRSLPYPDADQLYTLRQQNDQGLGGYPSYPTFRDWQEQNDVLAELAYIRGRSVQLSGESGPETYLAAYVSGGFFDVMGVQPLLGRFFPPLRTASTEGFGVVVSYDLWQQRYGGDPAVLGTSITIDDLSFTVLGVMPSDFAYPLWRQAFYMPLASIMATDLTLSRRDVRVDNAVIGRLAPGIAVATAQAQMNTIAQRIATQHPDAEDGWTGVSFQELRPLVLGGAASPLLILTVAVNLVLLIACVNLANVFLARTVARRRELEIRRAVGATRGRIVRQLLTESTVVAVTGGVSGLLLAVWSLDILKARLPFPRVEEIRLDSGVLFYTAAITMLTVAVFGLFPAWKGAASTSTVARSSRHSRANREGMQRSGLRAAFTISQTALTLVLLIGAGLMLRSLWQVQQVDLGLNPKGLVTIDIQPPTPRYAEPDAVAGLYRRIMERVSPVPGVRSVGLVNNLPLRGSWMNTPIVIPGQFDSRSDAPTVHFRTISLDYFSTMEIPVLRGRGFERDDFTRVGGAIVINQNLARQFWPDGEPLGQLVTVFKASQGRADFGEPITGEVVGVVKDVTHFGPATGSVPEVYVPYTWNPWTHASLVVRADVVSASLIAALQDAVHEVDPDIPLAESGLSGFRTMDIYLAQTTTRARFNTRLLTIFAAFALALALVGIYGVVAYLVTLRTNEIGIRVALGARSSQVVGLMLRHGFTLAAIGIGIGLVIAVAVTRVMRSILFGVAPTDLTTYVGVSAILLVAALVASYLPARRAARIDPMEALRHE